MFNRKQVFPIFLVLPYLALNPTFAFAGTSDSENKSAPTESKLDFLTHFIQSKMTDAQLKDAITAVDKLAQKQVEDGNVPGLAISIVHNDTVVFAKGFGLRETSKTDTVNADTVFQLASLSKPIASTVVAALISDGKVSWNSKICDLDPAFKMYEPWVTSQLTLTDLFAHRSGLPDHAGDLLEDIGYDRAQVLQRLRYQKPESSFRSSYAYTNYGITEGAVAAAKAYDLQWENACEQKLYGPLKMSSTSSRYADFVARANKAPGHVLVNGKWVQKYHRNPESQAPAGGVSSSANDMAQWMRLQLADGKFDGKQLIKEPAIGETHRPYMLTNFSPIDQLPHFYGLGFNVSYDEAGRLILGHSGAFSRGVSTNICMIPTENLGICVLTNAYPMGVPEGVAATFTDLALRGKTTEDWIPLFKQVFADPKTFGVSRDNKYEHAPASTTTALKSAAYVGKYRNEFYGDIEVVEQGEQLELNLGPKKMAFPMKHFDRDIFTYEADTEDLSGQSGVIFEVGADGRAGRVLIENLNSDEQGVFIRIVDTKK